MNILVLVIGSFFFTSCSVEDQSYQQQDAIIESIKTPVETKTTFELQLHYHYLRLEIERLTGQSNSLQRAIDKGDDSMMQKLEKTQQDLLTLEEDLKFVIDEYARIKCPKPKPVNPCEEDEANCELVPFDFNLEQEIDPYGLDLDIRVRYPNGNKGADITELGGPNPCPAPSPAPRHLIDFVGTGVMNMTITKYFEPAGGVITYTIGIEVQQ